MQHCEKFCQIWRDLVHRKCQRREKTGEKMLASIGKCCEIEETNKKQRFNDRDLSH